MGQNDTERKEGMSRSPGRALWQRSCRTDASEDEASRFLDLAAFADGRLETDERDRVAAMLAVDPAAAADVAAARALAGGIAEPSDGLDRIIARACAILPDNSVAQGHVLAFRPPRRHRSIVHGLTRWGSLAAAIAMASWLGFAMGSDTSLALSQSAAASDASFFPELLDLAGTGFLRDLGEGLRG
jgi:anti-sigma factor RsiW